MEGGREGAVAKVTEGSLSLGRGLPACLAGIIIYDRERIDDHLDIDACDRRREKGEERREIELSLLAAYLS